MGTDITDRACHARFGWISAPQCLFIPTPLNGFHQPILEVLHQYFTNRANCSCAHEVTRLAYRWVASVVMSQRENKLFLFDQFYQLSCLSQVKGHRLIAYDMDAVLQECARDAVMQMIRQCHHH